VTGWLPLSPEGLHGAARFLADGQYRNPGGDPAHFTTSSPPGLSGYPDVPQQRDYVLSVLRLLEAEPSLMGMSQNFLAIAQKPARC
jgi:hypothetical protein